MSATTTAPACPHAALARDFEPFDLTDPFAFNARARAETPIFYSPQLGWWVVTRYEDIREIFRDPATFSSENTQTPFRARPPEVQRILDEGGFSLTSGLSARQPPDHTRLRGFIKKAFTPRRVAGMEPEIREIATSMIDRFAARGEADIVSELAYELPALVIFRLLGVPEEDVAKVKEWAQSRVYLNFGELPVDEQALPRRKPRALLELLPGARARPAAGAAATTSPATSCASTRPARTRSSWTRSPGWSTAS